MERTSNVILIRVFLLTTLHIFGICGTPVDYESLLDESEALGDGTDAHIHWMAWSPWSTCSRTCGGGASYQTRGCHQGYVCAGMTIRYKTCNTQDCPYEELDFRSQQCAAYNDEKFENRTMEWEPVEVLNPTEQCSLVCRAKHHNVTRVLAPKVLDGTRCNKHTKDMCIAGKCEHVGCDYQFNSTAEMDRCGVCSGDNTTCQFMKGRKLVESRQTGLRNVMEIPAGSRTIKVTSKDLGSSLGLHSKGETKGLNQLPLPAEEGRYSFAGSMVYYRTFRSGREQITIEGPTTKDIVITVFLFDSRVSREKVHYQYLAPLSHGWKTRGWSRCSASCGGGQQTSVLECTDLATGETVADTRCEGRKPEIATRNCNNINCPPRWEPEPWHVCTKSCGTGNQVREVFCVQKVSNNMTVRLSDDMCSGTRPSTSRVCNTDPCPHWKPEPWSECSVTCGRGIITRDIQCRNHRNQVVLGCDPGTVPTMRKACLPGVPCLPDPATNTIGVPETRLELTTISDGVPRDNPAEIPSYYVGEWSACSTSCGRGIRTRSIRCKVYLPSFDATFDLNEFECEREVRPEDIEECTMQECTALNASDSSYPPSHHPNEPTEPNELHPGPTHDLGRGGGPDESSIIAIWRYVGYTPCSASCIGGTQESIVRCVNAFTDTIISDAFCDYSLKLPSSQRSCNEVACPPEWKIFLYGECSSTCGPGVRYPSDVYCVEEAARTAPTSLTLLSEDHCIGPRPSGPEPCLGVDCPAFWALSEWSECSATCGHGAGNKTRILACHRMAPSGEEMEIDFNDCPLPVPHTVEECDNDQCPPYWVMRPASQCSRSCGNGTQPVSLSCHQLTPMGEEIELSPSMCPIPPPPNTQPCNEFACPAQWYSQPLSECSTTCGLGIKLMSVLCRRLLANGSHGFVDESQCASALRPADHIVCDLPPCNDVQILANYTTYRQPSPSAKVRLIIGQEAYILPHTTITVKCPVINYNRNRMTWERGNTPIRDGSDGDPRMRVISRGILRIKNVEATDAGVYACVAGDQRETLTLHVLTTTAIQPLDSPSNVRWHVGEWGPCSATCGGGLQLREVACQFTNLIGRTRPRGTGNCRNDLSLGDEPATSRECNTQACEDHWMAEEWSECSGECVGVRRAIQTRRVFCQSPALEPLPDERCMSSLRPLEEQVCDNPDCRPKWLVTRWSSCSASCGASAVQTRKIRCVTAGTRVRMDSSICASVLREPPVMKKCGLDPCPNAPCVDEGAYCSLVHRLQMCDNPSYQRRCCNTCLSYG
ncbi:ADAMTS-like protein 3 [Diadema antillarum]|uniref:ADAMTS-like protein 3 n=1 Tax=Diadema antillarum TaxID=105358 RepID=UPI003A836527